jgi:hypothetical protein
MICGQSLALGTPAGNGHPLAVRLESGSPRRLCDIHQRPVLPADRASQRGLCTTPTSSGHRDDHDRSGHSGGGL